MSIYVPAADHFLLRQYLLCRLPAAEADRVEDRFAADKTYFAWFEEVERALLRDYVSGSLDDGDAGDFRQKYLVTAARRQQVAIVEALWELKHERRQSALPPSLAFKRWAFVAVPVALLLGIAVFVTKERWLVLTSKPVSATVAQRKPATKALEPKDAHQSSPLEAKNAPAPAPPPAQPHRVQPSSASIKEKIHRRIDDPPLPNSSPLPAPEGSTSKVEVAQNGSAAKLPPPDIAPPILSSKETATAAPQFVLPLPGTPARPRIAVGKFGFLEGASMRLDRDRQTEILNDIKRQMVERLVQQGEIASTDAQKQEAPGSGNPEIMLEGHVSIAQSRAMAKPASRGTEKVRVDFVYRLVRAKNTEVVASGTVSGEAIARAELWSKGRAVRGGTSVGGLFDSVADEGAIVSFNSAVQNASADCVDRLAKIVSRRATDLANAGSKTEVIVDAIFGKRLRIAAGSDDGVVIGDVFEILQILHNFGAPFTNPATSRTAVKIGEISISSVNEKNAIGVYVGSPFLSGVIARKK